MKYPKLRELKEAIKSLLSSPYTTKYPREPYFAENFRGKPEYNDAECVGCGACAKVCPARAIEVTEEKKSREVLVRKLVLHHDICIFCGQCEANCITEKGIKQTNEYALALFDRKLAVQEVEKELVLCSSCSEVIGTKAHLVFLSKKLGLLAQANPLLIVSSYKDINLLKDTPADKTPVEGRANMFKVLCPKCRRQTVVQDIWE
jgi:hydrogenase-4 component H